MTIGGTSFPYLIIFSLHSSDNEQNITLSKLFKEIRPFMAKLSFCSLGLYWLALVATDFSTLFSSLIITLGISAFFSIVGLIVSINLSTKIFIITERKFAARSAKPIDIKGSTSVHNQASVTSLDTDIDQALKMGQYDKVVSLLEESIKRNGNSTLRRQQLFLMLIELKDLVKLSRYAELFIDWMLDRNKIKDASQFIYQLRKHDPKFLMHDLKLINSLAKQFLRAKKYALVLWLAEDAKTRFQVCEELASLYLSGAQALITHFKDLEKAEEYLLFIIQSCDGNPSTESAKALLIHLQNNQKKQQDLRS